MSTTTTTKRIVKTFEDFEGDKITFTATHHGVLVEIEPVFEQPTVAVSLSRSEAHKLVAFMTADYANVMHRTLKIQDAWSDELEVYAAGAATLTVHIMPGDAPADSAGVLLYAWQWNEIVEALGYFNY
jgi:hypothetical protein